MKEVTTFCKPPPPEILPQGVIGVRCIWSLLLIEVFENLSESKIYAYPVF